MRHQRPFQFLPLLASLALWTGITSYAAEEDTAPATILIAGDEPDITLPPALRIPTDGPMPISPPPREADETPVDTPILAPAATSAPPGTSETTVKTEEQSPTHNFSNACKPQGQRRISVPKTLRDLRRQVGEGFQVCKRGPFLVASDVQGDEFSEIVDGYLACCRECLSREFFVLEPRDAITIYVFRDETSYAANLRLLFHMDPISPYGHYGHSQRYIVVNYATGPGTLVHELTHALMATDFPQAPIWLAEGMASLFEQCRVDGDYLRGEINWRLPELKTALAKGTVTPLSKLLAMTPAEFRSQQESQHYAESRYFCKYLQDRGALASIYRAFRRDSSRDPTGSVFIIQTLGSNLAAIERDWHKWLQGQHWLPPSQ